MATKVVYFSRSGSCKEVAEQIARELKLEVLELTSSVSWKSIWGFFRAAFYTIKNRVLEIELSGDIKDGDSIVAVAPVWAGMMAQPMRQFLTDNSNKTDLILLSNSSGSEIPALNNIQSKRDIIIKSGNREDIIKEVIKSYK